MARKKWRCHIGNAGFHFGGQPWLLDLHWMLEDPFWQAQFSCHWPFILQADCFWKCWGKMWANGWVVCSQPEVLQIMQLIFVIICHKPCGLTMLTEEICNLKTFQVMIACISFSVSWVQGQISEILTAQSAEIYKLWRLYGGWVPEIDTICLRIIGCRVLPTWFWRDTKRWYACGTLGTSNFMHIAGFLMNMMSKPLCNFVFDAVPEMRFR